MNFTKLNPVVRSAAIITKLGDSGECRAYDSRLIYIFSGDIAVSADGKKLGHFGAGDLIYIPAGMCYKLKGQFLEAAVITLDVSDEMPEPEERIPPVPSAEFDATLCHSAAIEPFNKLLRQSEMESEADTFTLICNVFLSAEGSYKAKASALVKLILLKLAEAVDESALPTRMVESLDNYIRENYADDITNTEIGAIFGYHPFYISKVLKDKKGMTLKQYVTKYKLKAARAMLENTAKTINEIAEETGFTDASYFTKTFKGAFGETPKEFRQRFKGGFV